MLDLMDITSRPLTPKEVSRVQLLSRTAPRITPGQLKAQYFGGYSLGQISSALGWDLELPHKPLGVRVRLCSEFLRDYPSDPVSPDALRRYFGLTDEQLLWALEAREHPACGASPRLKPVYPGSDWAKAQHEFDVELNLEGAYWRPLEVLYLHVMTRRRLRPVDAGIKRQHFCRFCSQEENQPSARTQYPRYRSF